MRSNVYNPKEDPVRIYELNLLGLSDIEIAKVLGVTVKTYQNWRRTIPEVVYMATKGQIESNTAVVSTLLEKALGYEREIEELVYIKGVPKVIKRKKYYPPDLEAIKFWLKNKTKNLELHWNDKEEHVHKIEQKTFSLEMRVSQHLGELDMQELLALQKISGKLKPKKNGDVDRHEEVKEAEVVD